MNWEGIRKEFETTDITMKDLAEKHGIKPSTLRSRKNREGWSRDEPKKATQQREKSVATQRNKKRNVATQKPALKTEAIINNSGLEDWEEVFCLEYLKHFNQTKAYQKAKPETTYESARVLGSRTFAKVHIQERLEELKREQRKELYIDSLDIKKQWLKQAFADITDFVDFGTEEVDVLDEDGSRMFDMDGNRITAKRSYVYFKDKSKVDGTLIQEVKIGRDGPVLKLYDKQKALQELMKLLGGQEEEHAEDDGFLEALEEQGGDLWPEE